MSEANVPSHLASHDALTDERRELTATRLGLYGLGIILVASIVVGEIYPALTSLMCMLLVACRSWSDGGCACPCPGPWRR